MATRPVVMRKSKILGPDGQPVRVNISAHYDAAQDTNRLKKVWANADGRDANATANLGNRTKLRNRARLLARNNSFLRGIIDTKATDIVGREPRLQVLTDNRGFNAAKELEFARWVEEIKLGKKLRLALKARITDGEVFMVFVTNLKLKGPVKLDVILVECDRVTSPWNTWDNKNFTDGIEYDDIGNPLTYSILKVHPGSNVGISMVSDWETVLTRNVVHLFKSDRAGQRRGVTECAQSLDLFALFQRYTMATVVAAETAADISFLVESTQPEVEPVDIDPMDVIEMEIGSGLTMPQGWTGKQMKAEQPNAKFPEFRREIANDIARSFGMPLNVALLNSSGYNYASGRLDHQSYFKVITVEQHDLGTEAVGPIYARWNQEFKMTKNAIFTMANLRPDGTEEHRFFFDGTEHVDPSKEATAQEKRIKNLTTSLAAEYARQGKDWEKEIRQIARERDLVKELGLDLSEVGPVIEDEQTSEERAEDAAEQQAEAAQARTRCA